MKSMPSFVALQDCKITRSEIINLVPKKVESVSYDICFGGMFYVIIDADKLDLDIKV